MAENPFSRSGRSWLHEYFDTRVFHPQAMTEAASLRLRVRLAAHLPEKALLLGGMSLGICLPYFSLQRFSLVPPLSLPATPVDDWIAFNPDWIYPYLSIALVVPLFPLLAKRREDLLRFGEGICLVCLPCFAAYLLLPVLGPRPAATPDHAIYQWLATHDSALNSFPSLHAGLTVYCFRFGHRTLSTVFVSWQRRVFGLVTSSWAAAIFYGTLATKQHWFLDLPPAIALAFVADAVSWRRRDQQSDRREDVAESSGSSPDISPGRAARALRKQSQ